MRFSVFVFALSDFCCSCCPCSFLPKNKSQTTDRKKKKEKKKLKESSHVSTARASSAIFNGKAQESLLLFFLFLQPTSPFILSMSGVPYCAKTNQDDRQLCPLECLESPYSPIFAMIGVYTHRCMCGHVHMCRQEDNL